MISHGPSSPRVNVDKMLEPSENTTKNLDLLARRTSRIPRIMPVYEYRALDKAGKNLNGIIDADSALAARQKLRGTGIFPVEVKETAARPKDQPSASVPVSALFKRVRAGELSALTRQLSTLLGAGITLVSSLDALITQQTNPLLKKIMAQVKDSVNEGNSLAFSLSQHPKVFSQIYINMVRAGEASGSLDLVLDRLAEYSEHQQVLRSRVQAALIYPIIMSIVGSLVLFFLITFVVDRKSVRVSAPAGRPEPPGCR